MKNQHPCQQWPLCPEPTEQELEKVKTELTSIRQVILYTGSWRATSSVRALQWAFTRVTNVSTFSVHSWMSRHIVFPKLTCLLFSNFTSSRCWSTIQTISKSPRIGVYPYLLHSIQAYHEIGCLNIGSLRFPPPPSRRPSTITQKAYHSWLMPEGHVAPSIN